MSLFRNLLWKTASAYLQDFSTPVFWSNIPASGDGSVLNLVMPKSDDNPTFELPKRPLPRNDQNTGLTLPVINEGRNNAGGVSH